MDISYICSNKAIRCCLLLNIVSKIPRLLKNCCCLFLSHHWIFIFFDFMWILIKKNELLILFWCFVCLLILKSNHQRKNSVAFPAFVLRILATFICHKVSSGSLITHLLIYFLLYFSWSKLEIILNPKLTLQGLVFIGKHVPYFNTYNMQIMQFLPNRMWLLHSTAIHSKYFALYLLYLLMCYMYEKTVAGTYL